VIRMPEDAPPPGCFEFLFQVMTSCTTLSRPAPPPGDSEAAANRFSTAGQQTQRDRSAGRQTRGARGPVPRARR